MLRVMAVVAALAVGATAVWAQNAAGIAARKDAMKAFEKAGVLARTYRTAGTLRPS